MECLFILQPFKAMAANILSPNILFVDIETVTVEPSYDQLDERIRGAWDRKAEYIRGSNDKTPAELYFDRGSIYAEFGKVIIISVGLFHALKNGDTELRIKCISGDDERDLLHNFKDTVLKFDQKQLRLCAHNGKEFDFPYLCRRMLINGISLPPALDLSGKKAWEVNHIDTMELWKFGDHKSYTPLELLAALFDIEASKEEAIDGSEINHVYHQEKNLGKIARYCKRNISMLAQVYLKLQAHPTIKPEHITVV